MANGFNRRGFVQLILGSVVGIHATPVVWKLMDDVAIWTQNWAWVPRPKDGEVAWTTTYSPICHGGCGVRIRLVNSFEGGGDLGGVRVGGLGVKVDGDPRHPVTRGGVCPTCLSSLQYMYDEAIRVTTPLARTGKAGRLAPIGWDDALNQLVTALKDLRDKGQAHTVAALTPAGGGTLEALVEYFLEAYGSPNFLRMPSGRDSWDAAAAAMLGGGNLGFNFEGVDFVLSLGAGLLEGFGDEVWSRRNYAALRRLPDKPNVPFWMADSRASNTASAADKWLAIKPGTEGALALGLCHLVIKKGKAGAKLSGLGEFKTEVLAKYAPAATAKITGVSVKDLEACAAALVKAKNPMVIWGRGKGNQPDGLYNSMAALALNALLGAVGRTVVRVPEAPLTRLPSTKTPSQPRLDGAKPPLSRWRLNGLVDAVSQGEPYPLNLLMIFGANPAFAAPQAPAFRAALKKIKKVVCFSTFLDETAQAADLVLPAPFYLETWNDAYTPMGVPFPVYSLGAPLFRFKNIKSRNPGDVLLQVARKLGGDVAAGVKGWKKFEDVIKFRVKGLVGKGKVGPAAAPGDFKKFWKALVQNGFWADEAAKPAKAGPIALVSPVLKKLGAQGPQAAMPHYAPLQGADAKKYPFVLVPYELSSLSEDGVPFSPFMTKLMEDHLLRGHESFVEMNPATGHQLGLAWGDRVYLEGSSGRIKVRVDLTERARPGYVFAPVGLGHTAFDHFIKGKGANTMDAVTVTSDPLSGLPVWPTSRVKVVKA